MKLSAVFLLSAIAAAAASGGGSSSSSRSKRWELIILDEDDDLCVGVNGGKQREGRSLVLVDCDEDDDDQFWRIDSRDRVVAYEDDDLCWEADRIKEDSRIYLEECDSGRRQKWEYNEDHDGELSPKSDSHLCVTYSSNNPDEDDRIKLKDCSGSSSQDWTL